MCLFVEICLVVMVVAGMGCEVVVLVCLDVEGTEALNVLSVFIFLGGYKSKRLSWAI